MAKINVMRTEIALPDETAMRAVSDFLFRALDGFRKDDRRAWYRFWKRVKSMEPGELAQVEMVFPRSGKFHRFHMALEQRLFDSQERFGDFEMLRYWLKVGAGWVTWAAGPKGGVVPVPKSISYAKADEEEFRRYHEKVIGFLRGPHAAPYLWPHLDEAARADMIENVLEGFES